MSRSRLAALFAFATLALAACGDDDDETTAAATADPERYCALSRELDEAGSETFRELESDADATPEDFAEAEAEFVRGHEAEFDELTTVAPPEIAADVQTLVASVRARGGLEADPPSEREAAAAEKAINAFERESC